MLAAFRKDWDNLKEASGARIFVEPRQKNPAFLQPCRGHSSSQWRTQSREVVD
jgi:hypothetical protein